MNGRMGKRILAWAIACALALALCVQGLAEQITVYAAVDGAKVYDARGALLGSLPEGTALTLTGVKGDICRVERGGKTAYMLKSELRQASEAASGSQSEAAEPEKSVTAYVAVDGARVYAADGSPAGTLGLNTQVSVTAVKGSACRIVVSGRTGYMKKSDLSAEKVSAPEKVKRATAYANKDGAKVVSAGGDVLATLSLNAEVSVTATKGGICQVEVNGKTGYMMSDDLSAEKTKSQKDDGAGDVVKIQATPGYVSTKNAKVYDATGNVVATLSQDAAVTVTAYNDNMVQVATGTTKGYMRKSDISDTPPQTASNKNYTKGASTSNGPVGDSTVAPARGTAVAMNWFDSDIQKIFARGVVAQITDVETGLSWREKRTGGMYHADCQPLTAADTAALKNAYGGVWSWNRRAVFVTIDGVNYAASINGMPHGGQSITDNNFDGHHCIHFTGSKVHATGKVDSQHQAAIRKAASTTLQ